MIGLAQCSRLAMAVGFVVALPLGGCGGLDSSLKDQEWFNRPVTFSRSLSIETQPLSDQRPVSTSDLISAEGACAGVSPTAEANALTTSGAPVAPIQGGANIAIGRTECEVARIAGNPDNVAITNEGGRRMVTLTYVRGPRPGIYRFTDGRMVSMERGQEEPAQKPAKGRTKRQG